MKVYDYPMAATGGGPGFASSTMAILIYDNLFKFFKAGYGQAIAIVFTIIVFAISITVTRSLRRREVSL
jgi:raffinose/stachyose/melibiose transport system permease protein